MSTQCLPDMPRDSQDELLAYAWPGGYPIVYIDGWHEVICPVCAREALADVDANESDPPVSYFVYYEGSDMYCNNCNTVIESAYGDPDADKDS